MTVLKHDCFYIISHLPNVLIRSGHEQHYNKSAAQQTATIFLTSKRAAQNKHFNFFFLISEAQHNFRNKLFDSVEAQLNSTFAERHFDTKSKSNLTSTIKITRHNKINTRK